MNRIHDRCLPRWCGYLVMLVVAVAALGCTWLTAQRAAAAAESEGRSGDQDRIDALYLEARLAISLHRYAQAADCLDEALKLAACPPLVYQARAEVYVQSTDGIGAARKILDDGLKKYPDDPGLLIGQSRVEEQDGRIDQAIAPQTADVFVDGQFAGTWRHANRNEHLRWFDSEFDIHPKHTRGKSSLDVRLKVKPTTGEAAFSDFAYDVFCYGP